MALILGVDLDRDSVFYIDHTPVKILELHDYSMVRLAINGVEYNITDKQAVEIYPSVFVSCGRPSRSQVERHKSLIEAANEQTIRRRALCESGKLTPEEIATLPPIEYPYQLLFRLIIDAPRNILILRQELYERQKRRSTN